MKDGNLSVHILIYSLKEEVGSFQESGKGEKRGNEEQQRLPYTIFLKVAQYGV